MIYTISNNHEDLFGRNLVRLTLDTTIEIAQEVLQNSLITEDEHHRKNLDGIFKNLH